MGRLYLQRHKKGKPGNNKVRETEVFGEMGKGIQ